MLPWSSKYKPKYLDDFVGQKNFSQLFHLIKEYARKPILLYGPAGTGKTTAIYAIANVLNYEVLELNASDYRDKNSLKDFLSKVVYQRSLFNLGKIILIDEAEGLTNKDRGAISALTSFFKESKWPIVLIVDDYKNPKLKSVVKKCNLVEFGKLETRYIVEVLKKICLNENVNFRDDQLRVVALKSGGDVRAAINDLQSLAVDGSLLDTELADRDSVSQIKDVLRILFKSKDLNLLRGLFNNVDVDIRDARSWVEENLSLEYFGKDLVNAYDYLSKSDLFVGRINRWQYWRFLVYAYTFLGVGVGLAKENKGRYVGDYKRNDIGLKIWFAKMKNSKKISITEKVSAHCHTSFYRAYKDITPYLSFIIRSYPEFAEKLEFSPDEKGWLFN